MIIDTSVIIAVLREEADATLWLRAIAQAENSRLSAASYVEAALVVDSNRDAILSRRLDEFLALSNVVVEPVTLEQARIARQAYRDFGKGSGHRAKLNFGESFAYALAKATGEPLLFKGDDFKHTDVEPALGPQGRLQEPDAPVYQAERTATPRRRQKREMPRRKRAAPGARATR